MFGDFFADSGSVNSTTGKGGGGAVVRYITSFSTRLLVKREIAKSRPEWRPRPRKRRDFFFGFMFEPRNRRELSNFAQSRSRSRREYFYSVCDPARWLSRPICTHPAHLPTPQRILILCVGALLAAHVLPIW
jgi:hypothetical protein